MAHIVQCTRCGAQYTATEQQIGTWAHCGCGTTFMIAMTPRTHLPATPLYLEPVPPAALGVSAMPPGPSGALPASGTQPGQGMPTAYAVAYAGPRQNTGTATAAMVLGIISLPAVAFMCAGLICGILAIIFGQSAKGMIRRGQMPATALGAARTGVICGSISTALSVILMIVMVGIMFSSLQAARKMQRAVRMPATAMTSAGGVPTGMIICEDGTRVTRSITIPLTNPDSTTDPYRYLVPGHGIGYQEYRCLQTGKAWAFGKDGQITSPFVPSPSTP